ncbi:hypothetical protein ABBQ38_004725 [Trebouxia sp. C0009 RCD-2024]
MAAVVKLKYGDNERSIRLVNDQLHIPTIKDMFGLSSVDVDGVAEPADDRGFTFATYLSGSTLHISGSPAQAAVLSGSSTGAKLDEILGLLKAKKVQEYTFGQSKTGRDMAVAAALTALGLTGLVPGTLPKRWARGWNQKRYSVFAEWPAGGQIDENTYAAQLLNHFVKALIVFEVPFGIGGFDFKDVRNYNNRLSFACMTGASTVMFNGGTDAAVIPRGPIPWQGQTRILFDWKRRSELQSVESVATQAQLELLGALFNSRHPTLVVLTDGVNFVILQPWGCTIRYWQTFSDVVDRISADDAVRLVAHHLLHISSTNAGFNHLDSVPEGSDLSMELAPLLAAKKELGEAEGLAVQLQVDPDLPANERLEAVSNTILAWRQPNLSYFS